MLPFCGGRKSVGKEEEQNHILGGVDIIIEPVIVIHELLQLRRQFLAGNGLLRRVLWLGW